MSLCSTNYISSKTNLKNLFWIIKNLGYKEISIEKELRHYYKKQYIWQPQNSDLTYVGIELNISKEIDDQIEIETRTRVGRSFLEIQHQNLTIKTIKNFFGGRFETDYGKNRYLDEEDFFLVFYDEEENKMSATLNIKDNDGNFRLGTFIFNNGKKYKNLAFFSFENDEGRSAGISWRARRHPLSCTKARIRICSQIFCRTSLRRLTARQGMR